MRLAVLLLAIIAAAAVRAADLPLGPNPPALGFPHFPSRLHAFVFRNWNLVGTDRLARTLDTSADNVRAVAASMGLEAERPIPANWHSRLYLTVIRRNWHLLPYDQLLTLLDVTPERLSEILREDDFFWIKLGSLKPKCGRIVYAPPDERTLARCKEIARALHEHFPDDPAIKPEPPLAFLDDLDKPLADADVRPAAADPDHPRFLYSYFAVFGDPLLDPALDPYPDALLQRYADLGVNGVWLHVVLRDLAPPTPDFPEFGKGHEARLANLAKLVARAKRFNVGVYLYCNEPRAMPKAFFEDHADLAGVSEGGLTALCTSTPQVRAWLADSLAHVFRTVPGLAGVFTITASENLTSCASHGHQDACARCKERTRADVIAEVNAVIERGVHRAAPAAKVICWDWGWPDAIAPDLIGALPKSAWLMSVSEWSLPIERGGVKSTVGEYSISAPGPGPRAAGHWQLAKSRGLRTVAKVQANCTWELSALPNLPTFDLVARHAKALAAADVDGIMLSWSLGGYPSPNLELFQRTLRKEDPQAVLDDLAAREFGPAGAPHARKAWSLFSQAFEQYPYHVGTVYTAPQQFGPANLLFAKATKYKATMIGFPYDDLDTWRSIYPRETFAAQFEKVAAGWSRGLAELAQAARATPAQTAAQARSDLRLATAAQLHFASVAAQCRYVMARDAGAAPAALAPILREEQRRAVDLYSLQLQDSRIGFEASNHYYYLPRHLQEKWLNCESLSLTSGQASRP
jgi:hypothetical protein